jgi:hypothetical protein
MEENRSKGHRLASRYRDLSALRQREMLVLRGQHSLTVYGCRRILFYSPCKICLCVGKKTLCVLGCDLYCASFSSGSVTIEGRIEAVSYQNEQVAPTKGIQGERK